jgi:hypothetical protein
MMALFKRETPGANWFLITEDQRDGRGYFVGYDERDWHKIGYLGPKGFSESEPARSMITRSGRPVLAKVWRKPSDMASMATSTPATPAMPMTMTSEVPRRWGMVSKLMRVISTI